jgi:hypothetical protein
MLPFIGQISETQRFLVFLLLVLFMLVIGVIGQLAAVIVLGIVGITIEGIATLTKRVFWDE